MVDDDPRLAELAELLAARLGLHFPPERRAELRDRLQRAAHEFGFAKLDDCLHWLLATPLQPPRIDVLANHLTRGGTGFFRDRRAFSVIEREVLPRLIEERRRGDRRLRFWSAACSTGEEPYSLAIALRDQLPDIADWHLSILGSDLNPAFLQRARNALFADDALIEAPAGVRQRWFRRTADERWALRPEIRRMVQFDHINLGADSYPSLANHTHAIDLLLCRQVLSDFSPAQAATALAKLARCLSEDGWLLLGPSEIGRIELPGLVPLTIDGVTLLRRRRSVAPAAAAPPSAPVAPAPAAASAANADVAFEHALAHYRDGLFVQAERLLHGALRQAREAAPLRLHARLLAVQGRPTEALACCERAIAAAPADPAGEYLHGCLLQDHGAMGEAMQAFQRALCLDPGYLLGHYGLGNLARRLGRLSEAERHFANARALAAGLSPDHLLVDADGLTAGRLREILAALQGVDG